MKKYFYIILSSLAFVMIPLSLHAQTTILNGELLSNMKTEWNAETLRLHFALTDKKGEGSRYAVFYTPRITTSEGDTLLLSSSAFQGKQYLHYIQRERHFLGIVASSREVAIGDTVNYDVTITRKQAPWLWQKQAILDCKREKDGCCSTKELASVQLGDLKYIVPFVPHFALVEDNTGKAGELQKSNPVLHHISEYKPYTKDRILRKEEGALYVHFELDKSELKHDFRGNAQTLDRIVDITRQIMADTTSSVKIIQIIGLASIEGSVKHNNELAGARANALKRYIQQRVKVADNLFDVANGGEAWTELRSQIEDSQFDGREELLRIIDTESNVNKREQRIRSLMGGKPYAYVKKNLLSDQRNSGYLRIFYDYVPDKAAKVINDATELIGKEKYAEALQQLLTVKDDKRAQNALGVAYYMTGNKTAGIDCFRKAAANGNNEAKENLKGLEQQ